MKFVVLLSILVSPVAFADGEETIVGSAKTEETVTLSQEATAPLFERVRGAHARAQQAGKIVATVQIKSK